MTPDQVASLDAARALAAAGVPLFLAQPDPASSTGYKLPSRWQQTAPDPSVVDRWQSGMALCAVMGHGLDLIDVDFRNGASAASLNGTTPTVYAAATTPSGGAHLFVRSLGVRSRDGVLPGVDVKAGVDGRGHGFAFIAPTMRVSKATGQPTPYRWQQRPDPARLMGLAADLSGAALRELISSVQAAGNGDAGPLTPGEFMAEKPPVWTEFERDPAAYVESVGGRSKAVHKLADALRGRGGWRVEDAIEFMRVKVWPHLPEGSHPYSESEFEGDIRRQWRTYPDGEEQRAQQLIDAARVAAQPVPPLEQHEPVPVAAVRTEGLLVDFVASQCMADRFLWARELGWVAWDGRRWAGVADSVVHDAVRLYLQAELARANARGDLEAMKVLIAALSRAKIVAVAGLASGHADVRAEPSEFDADPDLINTPSGVVDLRSGEVRRHDPALRMTRMTSGSYVPGFAHPDWDAALTALPEPERGWYQRRIGQAITGHPTPDGVMPVLQAPGENGKSALSTDGLLPALGDYAEPASPKLVFADKPGRSEHSTERADLRGKRLLIGEELTEGRALDVTAVKRIQDVGMIKARLLYKDNMTFAASHSLLITSNYVPVVNETDHGTWRRLALLKFPNRFRKPGEPLERPNDRRGDPLLKTRLKAGHDGRHDAVVTWAIEGARQWYADPGSLAPTPQIVKDTDAWRASADHVMGYWREQLKADAAACVLAEELRDHFNTWTQRHGHAPWSAETFVSRFSDHDETRRFGAYKTRTTRLDGLVHPPSEWGHLPTRSVPKQATVWVGVRFASAP